jgi:hypothetical protein
LPMSRSSNVLPMISCSFKIHSFTLRSLIHFELNWFLYRVKDRGLVSFFYMWRFSVPKIICWRSYLFSNMFLAPLPKIIWL